MMNSIRLIALTSLAAVVSLAPIARADEWDKKTILSVKESIQLPNAVLQPGTYTFKLLDSLSDRHIVQVFDKDGMHLITTILAIPNYRLQPTGQSAFTFWEVPAGQPPAMRAWFYPGDNFGQEFAYPKSISTQIASSAKMAVPTTAAVSTEEYKSAPIEVTDQSGQSSSLDSKTYTRTESAEAAPMPTPAVARVEDTPTEVATAVPPPAPQAVETPAELPHTASYGPAIGLVGLVSLLAFFSIRPKHLR